VKDYRTKIVPRADLPGHLATLRAGGARLVFTNGCFDLLHPGHVDLLCRARALGDLLLVAVNEDESVRRLGKGPGRPAVPLADRMDVAAELQKLKAELDYNEGFLLSVSKKLGNERFVQNAKPEIVENERKKQADAESKIASLKENIASLEK